MWMLAHAGLPVGEWVARAGHDPVCLRCPMRVTETLRHCLWICPQAHFVWRAVRCLLVRVGIRQGFVTWGSVTWLQHNLASHLFYEGFDMDLVFLLTSLGYKEGNFRHAFRGCSCSRCAFQRFEICHHLFYYFMGNMEGALLSYS